MFQWLHKTLVWMGIRRADPYVVSTEISVDQEMPDGKLWCREIHTLDNGEIVDIYFFADHDLDREAMAAARAESITASYAVSA